MDGGGARCARHGRCDLIFCRGPSTAVLSGGSKEGRRHGSTPVAGNREKKDNQGFLQRKGWNMAKKGKGIFLVYVDIDAKHDKEFNDWYNTEHLPELLAVPGILSAARYKAVKGGPKYLAFYELENVGVLRTSAFADRPRTPWGQRVSPSVIGSSLTRIVGEQIFPDGLEMPERGMAPVLQIGRMSTARHRGAQTYHIGAVSHSCRTWYRHSLPTGSGSFDPRFLRGERLSRILQPAKKRRPQLPARSRGATSWANIRMELSTQSTGIWPPTFDSMMMPVRPSSSRSCRSRASTMSGVP
jgi:hypothetical protein